MPAARSALCRHGRVRRAGRVATRLSPDRRGPSPRPRRCARNFAWHLNARRARSGVPPGWQPTEGALDFRAARSRGRRIQLVQCESRRWRHPELQPRQRFRREQWRRILRLYAVVHRGAPPRGPDGSRPRIRSARPRDRVRRLDRRYSRHGPVEAEAERRLPRDAWGGRGRLSSRVLGLRRGLVAPAVPCSQGEPGSVTGSFLEAQGREKRARVARGPRAVPAHGLRALPPDRRQRSDSLSGLPRGVRYRS